MSYHVTDLGLTIQRLRSEYEAAGRDTSAKAARATIDARLGRPLGAVRDMPKDERRALLLLARQIKSSRAACK